MIVNVDKTKEIVFHRPSELFSLLHAVTDIKQKVTVKLLGVTFFKHLMFMSKILRLFVPYDANYLNVLRAKVFLQRSFILFRAIVISGIL